MGVAVKVPIVAPDLLFSAIEKLLLAIVGCIACVGESVICTELVADSGGVALVGGSCLQGNGGREATFGMLGNFERILYRESHR